MILDIAYIGEEILYKKTKDINIREINGAKTQTFLNDLGETISSIPIAAGLAAPQVFKNLSVFAIKLPKKSHKLEIMKEPKAFEIPDNKPFFFINPKLSFPTEEKMIGDEACLSIPHYYGEVERYAEVIVEAYTKEGQLFKFKATKFMSKLIQHEFDHLRGILWTQRVKDPKSIFYTPEKEID